MTTLPFIKWPGGKRRLAERITSLMPPRIGHYIEPFIGGGAVYLSMAIPYGRISRATLLDANDELCKTYRIVRDKPKALIKRLERHKELNCEEYFYQIRDADISDWSASKIAARLIYLNKTCFNGLYRVNKKGKFNVAWGKYKNPDICNKERIFQASTALGFARIYTCDFRMNVAYPGDVIYCDPPYDGGFSSYCKEGFDANRQEELRNQAIEWSRQGALVIISNANTERIRTLYEGFEIIEVEASRSISRDASGRKKVTELLIRMPPQG